MKIRKKMNRDDTAEYRSWAGKVRRRDRNKCQWIGCEATTKLQCHHILRYCDFPMLRYEVSNGITLCKSHHDVVKNNEMIYAPIFQQILINQKNKKK
jgi:hypothetical protein